MRKDRGSDYHVVLVVVVLFLFFFFTCAFILCSLMSSVPFLSDYSMIVVLSVFVFFISFLCLLSLQLGVTGANKMLCL